MTSTRIFYALTLTGYFGTFSVLLTWYAWLSPQPVAMVLLVLGLPLLLPLRGLLHGRIYTVKWSLFLATGYFAHAVVEAWSSPAARVFALTELACTVIWFVAGIAFVRSSRDAART